MKTPELFLAALLCATAAWAEVQVVTSDETLRAAITLELDIQLGADIDLSNSTLEIKADKTITIDLNGHTLDRKLTKRGEGGGQVFTVRSGGTLNLSNGTVKGGWGGAGGALVNEGGMVTLTDVNITNNVADDRGGGICNREGGTLVMTGGVITDNSSNDHSGAKGGGGLFNEEGATATLTNVTITGNTAKLTGGGGICNFGTLTIDGCTITGNTAGTHGGAIWQEGSLNMQGAMTVTGNTKDGGMTNNLFLKAGAVITVTGSLAGSNIGIKMEHAGTFTGGYSTYNSGVAPSTLFSEDNPKHNMVLHNNEGCLSLNYLECSWDDINKQVVYTTKTLYEEIGFNDTPTSEEQYKVLTPSCDDHDDTHRYGIGHDILNLGTPNCPYHEFYVVKDNWTMEAFSLIGPHVHIILYDNITFHPYGVAVTKNTNFYLHAQSTGANMGRWHADEDKPALIGGDDWLHETDSPSYIKEGGNIFIHGCDINTTGGNYWSGIGGMYETRHGAITIFGGKIYASSTSMAAGIGGGQDGIGANTTITGGIVIAKAGDDTEGKRAIGAGHGENDNNALTIADSLGVFITTNLWRSVKDNRVSDCRNNQYVRINKCAHGGATASIVDGDKHDISNCKWCYTTGEEAHTFGDYGECAACGLISIADDADNTEAISHWAEENGVHDVTLSGRTLSKDGDWNTLCLPFALSSLAGTPLDGATVKTLESSAFNSSTGTLTLNFTQDANNLTSIEAGKPYIVKWAKSDDKENPVFTNVIISNATSEVATDYTDFVGIYSPMTIAGEDRSVLYLSTGNTLYYPSQGMAINACRAYFQLKGITAADISHDVKMYFGGDDFQTGIQPPSISPEGEGSFFDLNGRRLDGKSSRAGVYI